MSWCHLAVESLADDQLREQQVGVREHQNETQAGLQARANVEVENA